MAGSSPAMTVEEEHGEQGATHPIATPPPHVMPGLDPGMTCGGGMASEGPR